MDHMKIIKSLIATFNFILLCNSNSKFDFIRPQKSTLGDKIEVTTEKYMGTPKELFNNYAYLKRALDPSKLSWYQVSIKNNSDHSLILQSIKKSTCINQFYPKEIIKPSDAIASLAVIFPFAWRSSIASCLVMMSIWAIQKERQDFFDRVVKKSNIFYNPEDVIIEPKSEFRKIIITNKNQYSLELELNGINANFSEKIIIS